MCEIGKAVRLLVSVNMLILVGLVLGCSDEDDSIRIGFFGPLTGSTATAGQALRNGALIAIDEINNNGGLLGRQVALVEYDDRSSPEQAVKAVNRMVQVDRVVAAIGSLHSGNILAAAPVLERSKTPTLGAGTSPSWLEQGYRYLFRAVGNSALSVKQLASFAQQSGIKRVAVIHGNDEYGTSGADEFIEASQEKGIEIVTRESFTHGDRDFTGQFARILREKPDGVLIWALGDDLGALTRQLRQSGYSGPLLGSEGFTMPQVLEIAEDAADGVILAAQYLIPASPAKAENDLIRGFLGKYVEKYGTLPDSDNAYRGYDAVKIIARGITESQSLNGENIRKAIQSISGFQGLAGEFSFKGHNGEGIHRTRVYRIEKGEYVRIG